MTYDILVAITVSGTCTLTYFQIRGFVKRKGISMTTLLLFNIHDEAKRTAIRILSLRLDFQVMDVLPEHQNLKISELLSAEKSSGCNLTPFTDEMMVMYGFQPQDMHTLLDGMRNNGCPVRLKCVVT